MSRPRTPFGKALSPKRRPAYRNPMADEFFGLTATKTQRELWDHMQTPGAAGAAIGAKGSAKTFGVSFIMVDRIQRYPGSKFGIVANTYAQAFQSGAQKLVDVATALGMNFYFRTEMVLDKVKHYNVYVFPDFDTYVCVLSFEKIKNIEGTEWDGMHFEEIQDCKEDDVITALSRLRRGNADHWWCLAGMPEDESHWQYRFCERMEIPLWEPPVYENAHNLPPDYIARNAKLYRGTDYIRYLEGGRVSLFRTKVFHAYSTGVHKDSEASKLLAQYDPYRPLVVVVDFNVAPMCAAAFQRKPRPIVAHPGDHFGATSVGPGKPETIWVQVAEFEIWDATTRKMCEAIKGRFEGHIVGGEVFGDATGNRRDTRDGTKSDWDIIGEEFAGWGDGWVVRRGLVVNRPDSLTSNQRITYSNPPVRDTVQFSNFVLAHPNDGHANVLFLPKPEYEDGGVAGSVAAVQWNNSGKIDKSVDDVSDPTKPKSHFADIFRYFGWWVWTNRPPDEVSDLERVNEEEIRDRNRHAFLTKDDPIAEGRMNRTLGRMGV